MPKHGVEWTGTDSREDTAARDERYMIRDPFGTLIHKQYQNLDKAIADAQTLANETGGQVHVSTRSGAACTVHPTNTIRVRVLVDIPVDQAEDISDLIASIQTRLEGEAGYLDSGDHVTPLRVIVTT